MILLYKVRSILLRGFDQQMANKIGEYMEEHGVNMVRECVPESIEKIEEEGRERSCRLINHCLFRVLLES